MEKLSDNGGEMKDNLKEVFYKEKGRIPWLTGVVLDRDGDKLKIGETKYSIGIWYSEKDIDIESRSAKP